MTADIPVEVHEGNILPLPEIKIKLLVPEPPVDGLCGDAEYYYLAALALWDKHGRTKDVSLPLYSFTTPDGGKGALISKGKNLSNRFSQVTGIGNWRFGNPNYVVVGYEGTYKSDLLVPKYSLLRGQQRSNERFGARAYGNSEQIRESEQRFLRKQPGKSKDMIDIVEAAKTKFSLPADALYNQLLTAYLDQEVFSTVYE